MSAPANERDELVAIVSALLAKRADSAAVRAAFAREERYDPALWQALSEQVGVAALAVPEEFDGAGATLEETAAVLTEVAHALAPSPLFATSVATLAVLLYADDDAQRALLPRLAAGEVGTLAWPEIAGDLTLDGVAATIVLALDGDRLMLHEEAVATDVPALDPTLRLARLDLGAGRAIGTVADAAPLRDLALTLRAAEQAGVARRGLELTVGYSQERVQFGRLIGSFQALKHRMADMLMLTEMTRSAALGAAAAAAAYLAEPTDDHAATLARRAAAAASYCSDAVERVCAETVQLHGGIGITWEHDAHLVFKRGLALGTLLGPAHRHRARLLA